MNPYRTLKYYFYIFEINYTKITLLNFSHKDITNILGATFLGTDNSTIIESVSIDSRSMQNSLNTLFFALVGPNNDGHQFIEELIANGVGHFVVDKIDASLVQKANFFLVENTLVALQNLAGFYRKQFQFPIIGLTGSNGKTIVKEWLNFLLSPDYNIARSPKSYNSQVGVPLSILSIADNNNLGIFEAGISTTNEMEKLQRIINPTIGVLTNIGSAHDEGFTDISQKIKEKLKLFSNVDLLILNKNKTIDVFLNPKIKTFSWSSNDKNANVFVITSQIGGQTQLKITYKSLCFSVLIPFQDGASIENAIQCLMVLLYFEYDEIVIQNRMKMLFPVEMRLKIKSGNRNTVLIDDSYSSDYQSLKIALDFLEHQKQHKKKTLILSDIFQSGLSDDELYTKVSQLIIANKIIRVIIVGDVILNYKSKFPNCLSFKTTADLIHNLDKIEFENETILIKGARSFHFEAVVALLEKKNHETVLEINLNAISHNLNFYKSKLKSVTKLMVMVKAFGYGSGGFEIARLLEHHKIDYLGVAFADEGISLRNTGILLPIMVLNPEVSSFSAIIQHQLEPEIYSINGLKEFLKIAEAKSLKDFPIHIKLDTGMHRLGFQENDLPELIKKLKSNQNVRVKSILSHLATSDDLNHKDFANFQINLFEKLSSKLISELNINPIRHILNTSGISHFLNAQYDMVRLGIGLYGISNDEKEQIQLENVGTLKSIISQVRTINKDESVGYGRKFVAKSESKIATIPIGYADGIFRSWGNEVGYVLIKGQKATIVGNICMDMLMVDVSEINCYEGDEVVLFGENLSVSLIAKKLNTISYEILTSISQRVKRIFFRD